MMEPSTGKENIALVDFAAARDHEARKLRAELKTANDKMHSLKVTTYSMLAQARERDEQMVAKLAQCGAALRGKNEAISALEGKLQSLRKNQTVISSPPAHSHPVDAEVERIQEALRTADDTRRRVETVARERALRAHKKEMRMAEETNMLHAALKDRDATIQRLEAKLLQPQIRSHSGGGAADPTVATQAASVNEPSAPAEGTSRGEGSVEGAVNEDHVSGEEGADVTGPATGAFDIGTA
jgi:small-conductance mechanosensitive channel